MTGKDKGGKQPRGGKAGRAPSRDKMVGTRPDKAGSKPIPGKPGQPKPPKDK